MKKRVRIMAKNVDKNLEHNQDHCLASEDDCPVHIEGPVEIGVLHIALGQGRQGDHQEDDVPNVDQGDHQLEEDVPMTNRYLGVPDKHEENVLCKSYDAEDLIEEGKLAHHDVESATSEMGVLPDIVEEDGD